jgi:hypothetical protein
MKFGEILEIVACSTRSIRQQVGNFPGRWIQLNMQLFQGFPQISFELYLCDSIMDYRDLDAAQ